MRIGILGGSFDPPHFGHLLVARQAREIIGLDQIWLMPYFAHNWDKTVTSAAHRHAMTSLIQEGGIIVSNEEIKRHSKSYTIETIQRLKSHHNHEFFWIIGSDVLPEFHRWKNHDMLTREVTFLVFPRNGYPVPRELPAGFTAVSSPDLVTSNISSTIIRSRIAKGLSVVGFIPEKVLFYVRRNHLYDIKKK